MTKVAVIKNALVLLGGNIRTARRALKITEKELARRSGLCRSYLSGVESGRRNLSFFSLLAIARGLGATISKLTMNLDSDVCSPKRMAGKRGSRP
jgi:transcriptional regulator with XRE-family HTH domain